MKLIMLRYNIISYKAHQITHDIAIGLLLDCSGEVL